MRTTPTTATSPLRKFGSTLRPRRRTACNASSRYRWRGPYPAGAHKRFGIPATAWGEGKMNGRIKSVTQGRGF